VRRFGSFAALGLVGSVLLLPLAAAGLGAHAHCSCPPEACVCGHRMERRAEPPPCHGELAIEGWSCSKRPVQSSVPLPRLPDGELAGVMPGPAPAPAVANAPPATVRLEPVDRAVDTPPPRA
jgi:hypothetical protein